MREIIKHLEQQIEAYQLSENEAKEIIAELEYKNKELKKENELLNSMVKVNDSTKYDYSKLIEENKRLQMLSCANCGEKYLSPDGAELYEKNVQLQQENEKLKEVTNEAKIEYENLLINRNNFAVRAEIYRQVLEEIRKQYVNKAFFKCDKTEEECPCHNCIILGQLDRVQNIIKIIDEVLNEKI